jgi:hypothetical protein
VDDLKIGGELRAIFPTQEENSSKFFLVANLRDEKFFFASFFLKIYEK